jgi:hypothetical protein
MRRAGSSPSPAERRLAGVASPPAVCARLASPLPASLRSRGACSGSRRRASSTAAAAEHGTWLPPGPTRLALIVGRPNGRTSRGCFTVRVTGRPNRGCGSGPFADPVTTRPDRRTGATSVVRWVASRPDDMKRVASVGSRCPRPCETRGSFWWSRRQGSTWRSLHPAIGTSRPRPGRERQRPVSERPQETVGRQVTSGRHDRRTPRVRRADRPDDPVHRPRCLRWRSVQLAGVHRRRQRAGRHDPDGRPVRDGRWCSRHPA